MTVIAKFAAPDCGLNAPVHRDSPVFYKIPNRAKAAPNPAESPFLKKSENTSSRHPATI
jgi:hypothetical protein